jgi:hypothetical protein
MIDNQALVQLVSALAWPVTVIIIALLFRHEVRHTASRLSSLSYKSLKADFEQDLSNLEKDVKELAPKEPVAKANRIEEDKDAVNSYERLKRIADISPRAAIMEAWRDIEVTTKKVADAYGVSTQGQIAGVRAINELVQLHLLPDSVTSVYEQMRRLRSRAAHAADFAISSEEAERYIDTAYRFHNTLLFLLQQAKGSHDNKGG